MNENIRPGDGVYYHGSLTECHGLYTVTYVNEARRLHLASDEEQLQGVWPDSVELLIRGSNEFT
ncbi:hypothetical protein C6N75_09660 [Streptomyces solincola]|uniref:Uncharacterized protein n=1 Tax=Streptomyces solincola TaxID=2100817 RepID=A0A2S9PY42_9ACTN|nr:hypothetical protein [Streptomyces solincola]PRH79341.1 hypothetical protein C6N75_09660 [Streptomyces solincola]